MTRKQKLELTWLGKENRPKLEPRILLEDPGKSYHAPYWVTENDIFDNRLIFGDNLLALKTLEQEFTGKIKCIYIDPPYNTGSAFEHYDDSLEHSLWLSLMKIRLELLWKLLRSDGLLAVQIDDNEFARLFLLMAEVCGEPNLKVIVVKMAEPTGVKMSQVIKTGGIPKLKEYVILAGKSGIRGLNVERVPKENWDDEYRIVLGNTSREELLELKAIIENEHRSASEVQRADSICAKFTFETADTVCRRETDSNVTETWLQDNAWRIVRTVATTDGAKRLADTKRGIVEQSASAFVIETPQKKLYVIKTDYNTGSAQPRIRLLFADDYLTVHPGDFWQDIKTTGLGDEGGVDFTNGKKPEALIKRIIGMSTQPGDWVLDSFAGSETGTITRTAAGYSIHVNEVDGWESHSTLAADPMLPGERLTLSLWPLVFCAPGTMQALDVDGVREMTFSRKNDHDWQLAVTRPTHVTEQLYRFAPDGRFLGMQEMMPLLWLRELLPA